MDYDALLKQMLAKKYEDPSLTPPTAINSPDFRAQPGSEGSAIDPKIAGALANLFKEGNNEPTPPIGQADGKPVYDFPVAPDKGSYLPGGTPQTAGSAGIQQEQPGSPEWLRKIMAGVGM